MTAIQRRRLIWSGARTVLLTGVVMMLEWSGALDRFERDLYDLRVQRFQFFAPRPTTQLIHLDIDELALDQIGRWPWDREKMADILEEIRLAEPKVLAMDILFSEPAPATFDPGGKQIDSDARFTRTLASFGRALVPTSISFQRPAIVSPTEQQLLEMLIADPELTIDQCIDRLRAKGMNSKELSAQVERVFRTIRSRAILDRVHSEIEAGTSDPAKIKRKLLPHADPLVIGVLDRQFDEEYARAVRERALMRFSIPIPPGMPPVIRAENPITPLAQFSNAARYGAFVDYLPEGVDGTVRSVPLVAGYRGRLLPHMSLATTCAMLDVDPKDLRFTADAVIIPRPGGRDIAIPVSTRSTTDFGKVGMLMDVPMFGKRDGWETMYDYPRHQDPVQHVSIAAAWDICKTRKNMAINDAAIDYVIVQALALTDPNAANEYSKAPLTGEARQKRIETVLATLTPMKAGLASETNLDADDKQLLEKLTTIISQLREGQKQETALQQQLTHLRAAFHEQLHGKAVFLGGIATGNMDLHPTSLHFACPGIIIHGAIFNAIMTGRMWRVAPVSTTFMIIAAMGLLTGLVSSMLAPRRAFLVATALALGYMALNGLFLFDYLGLIVAAGGPILAAGLVWSGITLTDFITEIAERRRITHRFSSYVDPSLVNWVIEHPQHARFDGEMREMTMGFTDLAGFTAFTESLGERAVPLLAEYMQHMIPAIRSHRGFVSRLMGDGIFFFFNAPAPDPDHAAHAVSTMLAMHALVDQMNQTLPQRGFPTLTLRGGLCTGRVILGDAGCKEFSDYTAMGDSVNIAARLESANKYFGTRILASARTIELLKGEYLVRPIANVRLAGKAQGVNIYEPVCRLTEETSAHRQVVDLSIQLVSTYQAANFAACIEAADQLDRAAGPSKFSALYRLLSLQYQETPPDDFDGQIVLVEK